MAVPRPLRPALVEPTMLPTHFGALLRALRIAAALSQNQLARQSGCDPAYVNRLERAPLGSTAFPRRDIVLSFAQTVNERIPGLDERARAANRDRLLVASGLCPQSILDAGGWDRYVEDARSSVRQLALTVLDRLDDQLRRPSGAAHRQNEEE